jgi:uncharacterized protein YecA (UPF0149 family)
MELTDPTLEMDNKNAKDYVEEECMEKTEEVVEENTILSNKNYSRNRRSKLKPIVGSSRIPRNKPCPCGSGMKYKHCCQLKQPGFKI